MTMRKSPPKLVGFQAAFVVVLGLITLNVADATDPTCSATVMTYHVSSSPLDTSVGGGGRRLALMILLTLFAQISF
jgi:hypothetical protein